MELGQRLRQARLDAGLSQRQLCGEEITRNMLSQIENGSARPSMDTLRYLAGQLGKPVSFFLEEDTVSSPNNGLMESARAAFRAENWLQVQQILTDFREPDGFYQQERDLLLLLSLLALSEQAISQGRIPYAMGLLERAEALESQCLYASIELRRKRILLLAQAKPELAAELEQALPRDDRELFLRAHSALQRGDPQRSAALLDAAQDQQSTAWYLLRGEVAMACGDFRKAADLYHQAEDAAPEKAIPALEQCYRELEDYKMAYHYACKQK